MEPNGVVYRTASKPRNRDLWRADIRARCPECTAWSTTMAYSGFNTCETLRCPVDVFKADAVPKAPHPRRDLAGHIDAVCAVQVGPRLRRGEAIEQVRWKSADKGPDERGPVA